MEFREQASNYAGQPLTRQVLMDLLKDYKRPYDKINELVKQKLLSSPILYLSRYINQNKSSYYRLLQKIRSDENAWDEWVLFMLDGIEKTSQQTTHLIQDMKALMQSHKDKIRNELPKIYSQDLINVIFGHPYTKIDFVIRELAVSRLTATRYLNELVRIGLMSKEKKGRESYYINVELFNLFSNTSSLDLK